MGGLWRSRLSQTISHLGLCSLQTCLLANPLTSQMPRREAGRRSAVGLLTASQAGLKVSCREVLLPLGKDSRLQPSPLHLHPRCVPAAGGRAGGRCPCPRADLCQSDYQPGVCCQGKPRSAPQRPVAFESPDDSFRKPVSKNGSKTCDSGHPGNPGQT